MNLLCYLLTLSERISKALENNNIICAYTNHNSLKKTLYIYSKLKSTNQKGKTTHVVYSINWRDCPPVYIRESNQCLSNGIIQHKNKNNKTALSKHEEQNNHCFDFQNTKIINNETHLQRRPMHEMIRIK